MKNLVMVVTHKPANITDMAPYRPIIVGKGEFDLPNALRDNTDDNIAAKNKHYCELTALYWVWKNISSEYDNIGLCHYRRMFLHDACAKKPSKFITDEEISKDLSKYDIILPKTFYWKNGTVADHYLGRGEGSGRMKDLELCGDAIKELSPEYFDKYEEIIKRDHASYLNMFVMSKEKLDAYCTWMFGILSYVEKNIDMTGYNVQEQRVYGFLSEILLNVWVEQNNYKAKYYEVCNLEYDQLRRIREVFFNKVKKVKSSFKKK